MYGKDKTVKSLLKGLSELVYIQINYLIWALIYVCLFHLTGDKHFVKLSNVDRESLVFVFHIVDLF